MFAAFFGSADDVSQPPLAAPASSSAASAPPTAAGGALSSGAHSADSSIAALQRQIAGLMAERTAHITRIDELEEKLDTVLRARAATASPAATFDLSSNGGSKDQIPRGSMTSASTVANPSDALQSDSATTSPTKEAASTSAARVRSQMRAAVNAALHECAQACLRLSEQCIAAECVDLRARLLGCARDRDTARSQLAAAQQSLAESTAHIAWLMRSVVGAKPTLDKSMPPSALTEDLPRAPPSIATASHPPSNCGAEIGARGSDNWYCHACGRGNPNDMSGENGDAGSCDVSTAAGGTDGVLDGAGGDSRNGVSGGQERSSHAAQVPAESTRSYGRMPGVSRAPAVLHGGQSRGTLASAGPRICVPDAEATGQYGRIVTEKPFRLFPNPVSMAKLKHILPPSIVDTPPSLLESAFAWMGVSQATDPSADPSESTADSAAVSVSASSFSSPSSSAASSPSKPNRDATASPARAANQTPQKGTDDIDSRTSTAVDGLIGSGSGRSSGMAPVISLFQQQTIDAAAGPLAALMAQRR